MQPTLLQFLIICPMVFIAGFVDAIAGGGGLISLPAYLISGLPVHFALATNKFSAFMGTSIATFRFARKGYIDFKRAAFCVICALAGSYAGASIALLIDDKVFKIIMMAILPLTAVYVLKGKSLEMEKPPLSEMKTTLISMAAALVIGVYDGFYGPGTGTFLLLLLTGLAHMPLKAANGMTKAINWSTNLAAMVVFLVNGKTILTLGLAAGCFSIFGNYLGARFFDSRGAKLVKPIMIAVLCIFFVKVLLELLGK